MERSIFMTEKIGIGIQEFDEIREGTCIVIMVKK